VGALLSEYKLVTCTADASLSEAADLMRVRDVGMVLVVDENSRPIGLVTDRDLTLRALATGKRYDTTVAEVMTQPLETAQSDESLSDVMDRMRQSKVRRMPILDETGAPKAVLSFGDVYRWLAGALETLARGVSPRAA
jgi:CBS domain-containing protein